MQKVLIGGSPSSGSTLLSVMLDCHPEVFCGPETNIIAHPGIWTGDINANQFINLGPSVYPISDGITWARPSAAGLAYHLIGMNELKATDFRSASDLLDYVFEPRLVLERKKVACEKSPPNIYAIISALKSDPSLKAVITVRNGPDVLRSLNRRKSAIDISVLRWLSKMNVAYQAYKELGPDRVFVVRYEDLVSDPLALSKRLCCFLGVDSEVGALAMVEKKASKRFGLDVSISGDVGAAAAWFVKPSGPIGRPSDCVDEPLPLNASEALNGALLDLSIMRFFGVAEVFNAKAISDAFNYQVTWDVEAKPKRVKPASSSNRVVQFCSEISK